ncbi:MAG: CPBP family intramembrane metalloprotease [bacterium]|nr:CPBP family intramembrane metalloprotease [bacterium]
MNDDTFNNNDREEGLKSAVFFEGILGVGAVFFGWLIGFYPLDLIKLDATLAADLGFGLLITAPMAAAFILLARFPLGPFRMIRTHMDEIIVPLFHKLSVFDLLLISLLAGVGEELLFRGLLQPAIGYWTGPVGGLVIAGVLFGLAHLITPTYAIMAGLMGMVIGWASMVTDNLLTAILIHAAYDFIALTFFLKVIHRDWRPNAVD